jgi:hypothetical protein
MIPICYYVNNVYQYNTQALRIDQKMVSCEYFVIYFYMGYLLSVR